MTTVKELKAMLDQYDDDVPVSLIIRIDKFDDRGHMDTYAHQYKGMSSDLYTMLYDGCVCIKNDNGMAYGYDDDN